MTKIFEISFIKLVVVTALLETQKSVLETQYGLRVCRHLVQKTKSYSLAILQGLIKREGFIETNIPLLHHLWQISLVMILSAIRLKFLTEAQIILYYDWFWCLRLHTCVYVIVKNKLTDIMKKRKTIIHRRKIVLHPSINLVFQKYH